MINDNKNHEKPGTLHKLLLSLPINRIKKDHLCTTQSAPCSPIFMKKEQVNITHNLLNVERITSPYLKKKNNIHLNPLNETATTRPSTSSPLTANLKYLNDNLSIHRNKSKCQKINNGISSNHNKLNNLPLTQLELNIQQFKMIRKKLDEQQVNSNQNDDKLKHMKTPLNNECSKAQKQIRILGSKTDLSTSYSQGVKRLETPPPSYSDLEILNSSSRDNLLTKNTDKSNFTLLSTIDDQVHIYNRSIHPTETDKNQLINKHSNDNYNIDKCNYMTTNMIPSISSADYTNYSNSLYTEPSKPIDEIDSYREVVLQRHNASERFGMRLERTKGVRQVTYIAMILPRSPAQLAGLKVGDRLIRVNELETDQMLLEELLNYIRKSDGPLYLYYQTRPFTSYLLTTVIRKQNGKIGIKLKSNKNELQIDVVLPNSPASRVGLRSGQQVVSLNGQCVHGWDQLTAMHWFRHYPDGVDLTITVLDELDKTENSVKLSKVTTAGSSIVMNTTAIHKNNSTDENKLYNNIDYPTIPSDDQQIPTTLKEHFSDLTVSKESYCITPSTLIATDGTFSIPQTLDSPHEDRVMNPLFPFVEYHNNNNSLSASRCQSPNLCTLTSCPLKREDRKFYISSPAALNINNTCDCGTNRLLFAQCDDDHHLDNSNLGNPEGNFNNSNDVNHRINNQCSSSNNQTDIQCSGDHHYDENDREVIETIKSYTEDSTKGNKPLNFESNEKLFFADSFLQNEFFYKADCV
ncbi:unnamed protein product [Heterobilharzia americana]|nr:unnamed protein product [Heterobilharzia americana]